MANMTTFYSMATLADDFFHDNRDVFEKIMAMTENFEGKYFEINNHNDDHDVTVFGLIGYPKFVLIKNPVKYEIIKESGYDEIPDRTLWDSKSGVDYDCDLNAVRQLAKFIDEFREKIMEL